MGKDANIKALILKRSLQKRHKIRQEKSSVQDFLAALDDFGDRCLLVLGREFRDRVRKERLDLGEQPELEGILRAEIKAQIWTEILEKLGEVIGEVPDEKPAKRLSITAKDESKGWKTGVLEKRHVEKYGERKCEGCGVLTDLYETVTWKPPHGERIWHEKCRPKTTRKAEDGTMKVFKLAKRHVELHGERPCSHCGGLIELGSDVAWRVGRKEVAHVECASERDGG